MFVAVAIVCVATLIATHLTSKSVQLNSDLGFATYEIYDFERVRFREAISKWLESEGYVEINLFKVDERNDSCSQYFEKNSDYPISQSLIIAEYFIPEHKLEEHIDIEISRSWYSKPIGYFKHKNTTVEFELETKALTKYLEMNFYGKPGSCIQRLPGY